MNRSRRDSLQASLRQQHGAALIIGLVLLLVLTVLGVSGMNMSTLELTMAGNSQAQQMAFQAAETGIDVALSGPVNTASPTTYSDVPVGDGTSQFSASIACVGTTRVPDGAYSDNQSARAIHFDATSTGEQTARGASSTHTQGIYIVGPSASNPNFNPSAGPGSC